MCGKLYEFPSPNESRFMSKGYIIAYCAECHQENGRFYLPSDTDDLSIQCLTCGTDCRLIHVSEEEVREIARTMEEGMCELCMYYDMLSNDKQEIGYDPCENCNGSNNWEERD